MMVPEPTDEHRFLLKLVGHWRIEGEAMMGPDKPPETMTGTEHVRALGKLWTLGEGNMGQMPDGSDAVTLMTLGYDPAKGRFVGTFIGSMMTHMWIYDGVLDPALNALTLTAKGPNMSGDGSMTDYRDVITFLSDDHRTLESFMPGEGGVWNSFMKAHYRRSG
jgi:hypothetical protein